MLILMKQIFIFLPIPFQLAKSSWEKTKLTAARANMETSFNMVPINNLYLLKGPAICFMSWNRDSKLQHIDVSGKGTVETLQRLS